MKLNFIGSYLSWVMDSYDLGAVVITAAILEKVFYPTLGLLGAVLPVVFTVAARPLGAFLFGLLADLRGRKKALVFTVLGYSLSIGITGLVPPYAQIGIVAPVLISMLRVIQGIFIGGDVSSSFTLAMESVSRRRGLFSGLMQSGTLLGFVLVDLLFTSLAKSPSFFQYTWRYIYFTGVIPAVLALLIRAKMTESKVYLEAEKDYPTKGLQPIWQTILVMIGFWVIIYAGPQFIPVYLGQVLKLPPATYGFLALIMNVVGIPTMIISGLASDLLGRKTLGVIGVLVAFLTALWFYSFGTPSIGSMIAFGIGMNVASSISPAYLAERFKTFSRATGVGSSYNGAFLVAGFTQLFISGLSAFTSTSHSAIIVVGAGALVAGVGLLAGPETLRLSYLKV
ncbi:MHS family MFS transporter [Metallosphaera tengchongensis]|uniref:MHS family MFS transporter n=1 Tax=Metallosphaera tengchongensis TaxID=1532350 RepID=A0A6N0NYB8_9CREN|nr:MFS transporter [Metallosphaera tengchongensis]QKR00131.1 MHS family MFS transporter [Metallosphaera tengchongensis]